MLRIRLVCTLDAVEAISDFLLEQGALAVSQKAHDDEAVFAEQVDEMPLWQHTEVEALFAASHSSKQLTAALKTAFPSAMLQLMAPSQLKAQDWQKKFRQPFHAQCFNQRLWITPSWEQSAANPEQAELILDPGIAFGTGTHATTALCLQWLAEQELQGKTVLDYGCGSGILALSALRLGAAQVYAIDHDPQACAATKANAEKNQLMTDKLLIARDETIMAQQKVDIVLANILANTLIALQANINRHLKPQGLCVLSGILATQQDDVLAAYAKHFSLVKLIEKEGWLLIHLQKKAAA